LVLRSEAVKSIFALLVALRRLRFLQLTYQSLGVLEARLRLR